MRTIVIYTEYERPNVTIDISWHKTYQKIYYVKNTKGLSFEVFTSAFALHGNTPIISFENERSLAVYEESEVFSRIIKSQS